MASAIGWYSVETTRTVYVWLSWLAVVSPLLTVACGFLEGKSKRPKLQHNLKTATHIFGVLAVAFACLALTYGLHKDALYDLGRPIFDVPVSAAGGAVPDLSKSLTQRVFLTADTSISTPILPKIGEGASLTWVLLLDQDATGGHAYRLSFIPSAVPLMRLLANTRSSVVLVTDDKGHTMLAAIPSINIPIPH